MTPALALGRAIATVRTMAGKKRSALAVDAGVSYPYLCQIEAGVKEPSLNVLRSIAAALDMEASELLRLAERISTNPTTALALSQRPEELKV